MPDRDDSDPQQLRERVRELEQTVGELTDRIDNQPAIGRRSVLGGVLGAAGLGSLGTYGVQRASAQASGPAGQQGTGDEPNDMYAWDLDVQNGATFNGNDLTDVGALETDDGTIGGDPILGMPSSPSDAGLTLDGGWTVVDADQPTLLFLEIRVETDGTTRGQVNIDVDHSGGTTSDLLTRVTVDSSEANGSRDREHLLIPLTAGASVNISNDDDPNGNNLLLANEKWLMSS